MVSEVIKAKKSMKDSLICGNMRISLGRHMLLRIGIKIEGESFHARHNP
jgi:hypothetical protein